MKGAGINGLLEKKANQEYALNVKVLIGIRRGGKNKCHQEELGELV